MKRSPLKRKTPLKAKAPMKRSSRPKATPIRQSANSQPCQVRVPFICNGDSSTTVLVHLNGAGLALKTHTRAERDLYHLEGVINTQRLLVEQGYKFVKVAA